MATTTAKPPRMLNKAVGDRTYLDLPPIGTGDQAGYVRLAQIAEQLAVESGIERAKFAGVDYAVWDDAVSLYQFGRVDGQAGDDRPTINLTQNAINTFTALATRTPSTQQLKVSSVQEQGQWVLIKPFTIQAPMGPDGQPSGAPIPLQLFQPIPQEVIDANQVGKEYRVCINTETVVDFFQIIYDFQRRDSRMDQVIRDDIFWKQLYGWVMGVFQWDEVLEKPMWQLFKSTQWFPDPVKSNVDGGNYYILHQVVDAEEAKRLYPDCAESIDKNASKSIDLAPNNFGYDPMYMSTVWQRPIVTLVHCWLRNQPAPMTLEEAMLGGHIEMQELVGEEANPQQPSGDEAVEAGAEQPETEGQQDTDEGQPNGQPQVRHAPIHTGTGADLSDSFNADGSPSDQLHADHPMKLVVRQWTQIRNTVVPGSDMVCPHWDIPVWLDKNVQVPGRPFAFPETERLRPIQKVVNDVHEWTVQNVSAFRAATTVMDRSQFTDVPEGMTKNGFMDPGKIWTVQSNGNQDFDIRKCITTIDPPQMPPALPMVEQGVHKWFDIVAGNPGNILGGSTPTDVTAARAISQLQGTATNSSGLKSQYSEEAIWRMGMLMHHGNLHWMSIDKIMKICRKYPREVVENYIVPYGRDVLWDLEVLLDTGAGAVKQQKDATTRQDAQTGILTPDIAADMLGYDSAAIEHSRAEQAMQQAKIQQMAQPQPQQQQPEPKSLPETIGVAVKFADLPPSSQAALLKIMGLPAPLGELENQKQTEQQPKPSPPNGE